jgi:hypothetical protein
VPDEPVPPPPPLHADSTAAIRITRISFFMAPLALPHFFMTRCNT